MKKKSGLLILMATMLAAILVGCSANPSTKAELPSASEAAPPETSAVAAKALTVDAGILSSEPQFIDWDQDGTAMQLIALKSSAGEVQHILYALCHLSISFRIKARISR